MVKEVSVNQACGSGLPFALSWTWTRSFLSSDNGAETECMCREKNDADYGLLAVAMTHKSMAI
jgi:hypothetical protein